MSDQTVEIPAADIIVPTSAEAAPAVDAAPATTEAAKVEESADAAKGDASDKEAEKAKILKQVEFYFSDSNLPSDKFMSEMVNKGQDGCMSLWENERHGTLKQRPRRVRVEA